MREVFWLAMMLSPVQRLESRIVLTMALVRMIKMKRASIILFRNVAWGKGKNSPFNENSSHLFTLILVICLKGSRGSTVSIGSNFSMRLPHCHESASENHHIIMQSSPSSPSSLSPSSPTSSSCNQIITVITIIIIIILRRGQKC